MGRGVDIPCVVGVNIPWVRGRYKIVRGFDIPWVGGRHAIDRGVNIPWV